MKDIFILARAKIADPKHWTQGAYARDAEGVRVFATDPNAVCWCAMGAILAVMGKNAPERELWEVTGGWGGLGAAPYSLLVRTNDRDGHGAALAVLDRLIEQAP